MKTKLIYNFQISRKNKRKQENFINTINYNKGKKKTLANEKQKIR